MRFLRRAGLALASVIVLLHRARGARAGSDRVDYRHHHRFEQRRVARRNRHAHRRKAHRRRDRRWSADASGAYRFDRLSPGTYAVKFELQGFKTVTQDDIRISAAFVATVNGKLEVGSVSESITVTGESPTIDTKSNVQQTVMNQEILEGVPTGRDPWSLAKLIPGVQVATYDVGGTQSMQQSSLSSHGSNTNDVSFNIDGATVNWPGGGGGATMLYYDQGMFEEVNYMTSAIPAEVMAGGVSINMVTKDGGNKWRGNMRYSFANDNLQSENHSATTAVRRASRGRTSSATRRRRPTTRTCRAAARWSRTSCGSTARSAMGRQQAGQRARTLDGTRRWTTTT